LVYSWESYHKNRKGKLFIDTQCMNHFAASSFTQVTIFQKNGPFLWPAIGRVLI